MFGGLIIILMNAIFQQGNIQHQAILTENNFDILTESSEILLTE